MPRVMETATRKRFISQRAQIVLILDCEDYFTELYDARTSIFGICFPILILVDYRGNELEYVR